MKRLAAIVCGTALAAMALTGCGSDDGGDSDDSASGGGDYCGQVRDIKDDFSSLAGTDVTVEDMREATDRIGDVADAAPSDISSEWDAMHGTIDEVVSAYEDSGIATDEPLQQAGPEFEKEEPDKAKELAKAASNIQDMQSESEAIKKEVKSECDFDLAADSTDDSDK